MTNSPRPEEEPERLSPPPPTDLVIRRGISRFHPHVGGIRDAEVMKKSVSRPYIPQVSYSSVFLRACVRLSARVRARVWPAARGGSVRLDHVEAAYISASAGDPCCHFIQT